MKNKLVAITGIIIICLISFFVLWLRSSSNNSYVGESIPLLVGYDKSKYTVDEHNNIVQVENDGSWITYVIDIDVQFYDLASVTFEFKRPYSHPVIFLDRDLNVVKYHNPRSENVNYYLDDDIAFILVGVSDYEQDLVSLEGQLTKQGERDKNSIRNSTYRDKYVSVLGDSLSAFSGYIDNNYLTHYPYGDVGLKDMWWYKVSKDLGMNISYINACAGSGVTELTGDGLTPDMAASSGRASDLERLGRTPDVILVWIGGNDMMSGISKSKIANDYKKMVKEIYLAYPQSDIFLMSVSNELVSSLYPDSEGWFIGLLEEIADDYGINTIDVGACNIEETYEKETTDIHPNKIAMNMIANWIVEAMLAAK